MHPIIKNNSQQHTQNDTNIQQHPEIDSKIQTPLYGQISDAAKTKQRERTYQKKKNSGDEM